MNSLELCAGAGGQALGLERAGFEHRMLVEIDPHACATLRHNRPHWQVQEGDLAAFDARSLKGIDLVAGGVPCPPFSKAGKQLGADDERDLFPQAIRVVNETRPQAVMLENVRGLLDAVFVDYRNKIARQLQALGYWTDWHLFNAADFGVCQLRPRVVFVALRKDIAKHFRWPAPSMSLPPTVGELLADLMAERGWKGDLRRGCCAFPIQMFWRRDLQKSCERIWRNAAHPLPLRRSSPIPMAANSITCAKRRSRVFMWCLSPCGYQALQPLRHAYVPG